MKNSKEYSKKIQKLFRDLKKKYSKQEKVEYADPIDALIYAIISEKLTEPETSQALKSFGGYFIDNNDLRVARPEEILECFGQSSATHKKVAKDLREALMFVFDQHNTVSLEDLKKLGKRPVKEKLSKIQQVTNYVLDYIMLTGFAGHAIPLTETMIDYLKSEDLVHPDSDYHETEGFLSRQISAKNDYDFYYMLRKASEADLATKNATKKVTKKTVKKTKKKTTKKTVKEDVKKTTAKKKVKKAVKKTAKKKTTKKK